MTNASYRRTMKRMLGIKHPLWAIQLAKDITKPLLVIDSDTEPVVLFPIVPNTLAALQAFIDELEADNTSASLAVQTGFKMVFLDQEKDFSFKTHQKKFISNNLSDPERLAWVFSTWELIGRDASGQTYSDDQVKADLSEGRDIMFVREPHPYYDLLHIIGHNDQAGGTTDGILGALGVEADDSTITTQGETNFATKDANDAAWNNRDVGALNTVPLTILAMFQGGNEIFTDGGITADQIGEAIYETVPVPTSYGKVDAENDALDWWIENL